MRDYIRNSAEQKNIVVPLFNESPTGFLPNASGILVTYGNRQFLCTAAHAIDRYSPGTHSIMVGGGRAPFPLENVIRNRLPDGETIETDPYDVAIAELTHDQVSNLLFQCRFLGLDLDTPWQSAVPRLSLQACGFLCADNHPEANGYFPARGLKLHLTASQNFLRHQRHPGRKSIWPTFVSGYYRADLCKLAPGFKRFRDFEGLSGGALFWGDPLIPGVYSELAGMLIETHASRRKVHFVGVGTRALLTLLHRWFPGLPALKSPSEGFGRKSFLK